MIGVACWRWARSTPTELMIAGSAITTTYVSAAPRRTPALAKPSRQPGPGRDRLRGLGHLSPPVA